MTARSVGGRSGAKVEFIFLSDEKQSFFSAPHLAFFSATVRNKPIDCSLDFER